MQQGIQWTPTLLQKWSLPWLHVFIFNWFLFCRFRHVSDWKSTPNRHTWVFQTSQNKKQKWTNEITIILARKKYAAHVEILRKYVNCRFILGSLLQYTGSFSQITDNLLLRDKFILYNWLCQLYKFNPWYAGCLKFTIKISFGKVCNVLSLSLWTDHFTSTIEFQCFKYYDKLQATKKKIYIYIHISIWSSSTPTHSLRKLQTDYFSYRNIKVMIRQARKARQSSQSLRILDSRLKECA